MISVRVLEHMVLNVLTHCSIRMKFFSMTLSVLGHCEFWFQIFWQSIYQLLRFVMTCIFAGQVTAKCHNYRGFYLVQDHYTRNAIWIRANTKKHSTTIQELVLSQKVLYSQQKIYNYAHSTIKSFHMYC